MAYSNYGGYAYKNGVHIRERSDAVFSNNLIKSTPGQWPGFTLKEGRNEESFHVILGDSDVFVCLNEQLDIHVCNKQGSINFTSLVDPDYVKRYADKPYVDTFKYIDNELPCKFIIDSHTVTIYWEHTDNYYQYVRLEQPNGDVWTGFSGYGVGIGFEDGDYGYSTSNCITRLNELFNLG